MGAQPSSQESLLSPKQDQGFWLSSGTDLLCLVSALVLGMRDHRVLWGSQLQKDTYFSCTYH